MPPSPYVLTASLTFVANVVDNALQRIAPNTSAAVSTPKVVVGAATVALLRRLRHQLDRRSVVDQAVGEHRDGSRRDGGHSSGQSGVAVVVTECRDASDLFQRAHVASESRSLTMTL
jgi:hypothetical protein